MLANRPRSVFTLAVDFGEGLTAYRRWQCDEVTARAYYSTALTEGLGSFRTALVGHGGLLLEVDR